MTVSYYVTDLADRVDDINALLPEGEKFIPWMQERIKQVSDENDTSLWTLQVGRQLTWKGFGGWSPILFPAESGDEIGVLTLIFRERKLVSASVLFRETIE